MPSAAQHPVQKPVATSSPQARSSLAANNALHAVTATAKARAALERRAEWAAKAHNNHAILKAPIHATAIHAVRVRMSVSPAPMLTWVPSLAVP